MATKETTPLNPRAIFSKTGKGVQEASGKTSHLSRGDRAVLKEIDGKTTLADIALKFEKISADKFDALVQQLDKDGFVREVSSGVAAEPITPLRRGATPPPPPKAAPKAPSPAPAPSGGGGGEDFLDFTQAISLPPKGAPAAPKAPAIDLAASARAEAEKKAKEQAATDYRAREEAEAKAKAEAEARARAAAEAKAKAEAEARARAEEARAAEARAKSEADARARAESEAKARAVESEAKAKQARDMALRMASEAKAKAEAEAKDKARLEAELKAKLEEERRAREDAEKRAAEAAERARKELEEKTKREAEELRQRLEAEMKAKLEEERRAREEEDRKRREEEERRRKEERERHEKELAERRAKEEAERKQREEEERKRREDEERRRKEERERHERELAESRAKEEAERKQRAKQDEERRAREEEDRKRRAKEEDERRSKDEEERKRRAREEDDRRARDEAERKPKEDAKPAAAAPAASSGGDLGGLLDDLDSFGQKEEEERKAKEEAERKAKADAEARARAEEERKRREEEDRKRREEEERRAKAEAERKAKEDEERREREEEERRKEEEAERKRKAKEAQEKKQAEERAAQKAAEATLPPRSKAPAKAGGADDIGVSDEDLDLDDVRRDESRVSKEARQAAKEREQVQAVVAKRPMKWGKPVAIAVFVILIGGIGALQVMPLSTSDYEKAASEALGVPVKVSSARLSVITGVQVNLENVTVGDVKIRLVRGYPEVGSVFGARKSFNRLELEGATLSQAQLGEAFFGKVGGPNFRVGRIVAKGVKMDGPLTLPPLDIDATVAGDGALQAVNISGPDKLALKLTPNGNEIAFEASAASLAIPFVPSFSLSDFGWKGTANRQGVASSEFDGRQFDGLVSGTARIRWGSNWTVEGEVRSRGVKVGVFAPSLVSEGKVEGRGNYTMSGPSPAKLGEAGRLDGSFKIENGVIGNFALRRALETGGAQTGGRTEFTELTGQGVYEKGVVQLRNLNVTAGAMSAGASLDIDAGGTLAGRIAAEVKTPNQTLRAVLNISGSLQNPVIKK